MSSRYYIQPIDPAELASRFSTEDMLNPIHGQQDDWMAPRLDKIKSLLDRLPDRESDLIRLYYFKDKNQTDIAEIFDITQAAVSYRLQRALSRIRFLVEMPDLDKNDIYDILLKVMPSQLDAKIFSEMYETTCQSVVAERLEITQGRVRHRFIKNLRHLGEVLLDQFYSWVDTLEVGTHEAKEAREQLDLLSNKKDELEAEDFENAMMDLVDYISDFSDELSCEKTLEFASVYGVFVQIRYNFNILREVKLPKWSNRATNTIA